MNHTFIFARTAVASLCLLLATAVAHAQTPMPKHEVRAVWLTTIGGLDWPHSYSQSTASANKQKRELCDILDRLQSANVNTVLLQTRVRGTVIYPSAIEPWDGCLSGFPGKSPGYDALQFAIDECHRRGMELHAWIVAIPIGRWNALGCKRLRTAHPSMVRRIGDEGYLNPERPETADYLARLCREVAANYDIDGIHLDYIRYPETWTLRVSRNEGRRNITAIVRKTHDAVKSIKPWVKMSCSPVGKHDDLTFYSSRGWNAYDRVCQDAQGWLRDGLMDELFPMMYFKGDQFFPFAVDWRDNSHGRIVAPGLGIYMMSPKENNWDAEVIYRELQVLRRMGGMGHAYFRSKFFTDNTKGVFDMVAGEIDPYPALVPPMTWQSAAKPTRPASLRVGRTAEGDMLEWGAAASLCDCPQLTYNVYASTTYPVDTDDATCLVAVRLGKRSLFVPRTTNQPALNYAVRAMDRYGNEGEAACTANPQAASAMSATSLLRNDGRTLWLPGKGSTLDADFVAIEDLQGRIVATMPYTTKANIARLADGLYVAKSLGRKGATHRLGWFAKKTTTLR